MLTSAARHTVAAAAVASQSPQVLAAVSRRLLSGSRALRRPQAAGSSDKPHTFEEPHLSMHTPRRSLDDELARIAMAEDMLHAKYEQLRHDLEGVHMPHPLEAVLSNSGISLQESLDMAAAAFSESSTFPEFTPAEDVIELEAHRMDAENARPPLPDVTRLAAEQQLDLHDNLDDMAAMAFSESSVFPEYTPVEDVVEAETHRLDAVEASMREPLVEVTRAAAEAQLNLHDLDDRAAGAFTEASAFPEFTPIEDLVEAETHRMDSEALREQHRLRCMEALRAAEQLEMAQAQLMDEMDHFCAGSDFPECSAVDEIMELRKRA